MHPWVAELQRAFEPLADEQAAKQMSAYLRNQFVFYGIKAGPRRAAMKPLMQPSTRPELSDLTTIVHQCWQQPQREFQQAAVDLLIKHKKHLEADMLADVEHWIGTKAWWDTVDFLATHIVAAIFMQVPDAAMQAINNWRTSDNIWLRRTCILFQLKFKDRVDEPLLRQLIIESKADSEFFIQKAIGWMLREYSKTNAHSVYQMIDEIGIEGLAKREAFKWLNR